MQREAVVWRLRLESFMVPKTRVETSLFLMSGHYLVLKGKDIFLNYTTIYLQKLFWRLGLRLFMGQLCFWSDFVSNVKSQSKFRAVSILKYGASMFTFYYSGLIMWLYQSSPCETLHFMLFFYIVVIYYLQFK